ncbi:MAG TPA: type II toxin-antitoxin system VapC family toxin [Candidatus Angelobacter sp.]|jgi:tRNA(fMet)-specific endonuclease VapC|nr:type II toxin-antitoxin system VapC family toxin [Candidatus Angelobacter sp.]
MSGRALLDTNAVIALFAGEPGVAAVIAAKTAVFVCVPVIGELRYGALASARVEQNLARLDEFAQAVMVLPCDAKSAAFYAAVKFDLRKKGRPIPENDVWIAALARQHDLSLISRDGHFQEIDGLDLELLPSV